MIPDPNVAEAASSHGAVKPSPYESATNPVLQGRLMRAMDVAVDLGFAVLLLVCGVRYFTYHPLAGVGALVLLLAVGSGASYACAVLGSRPAQQEPAAGAMHTRQGIGLLLATGFWVPLAVLAPSFGWCAFALFFAVHRVVSSSVAFAVSGVIVVAVSTGLFIMSKGEDLGLVLGPFFGGLVLLYAHRALDRALAEQQRLIVELMETREQLARSERDAGALAERSRVASELHDTVVQRTASALLLLETDLLGGGGTSTAEEAREELREALVETRQLMHGLADPHEMAPSLTDALRRQAETSGAGFDVDGAQRPVELQVAHALQRVVREALLNVRKHARAEESHVTLTFFPDSVGVDIADTGVGFVPATAAGGGAEETTLEGEWAEPGSGSPAARGGFGLRAMAWRVQSLGGEFSVDSVPGRGTVVGALLPDARYAETSGEADRPETARGTEEAG